jgi:hypothetical protein
MTDVVRFTDAYIDYAHEFTDCPDPFLLWGALLAISASLSRRVYVEAGSWNISPHLWVVLIGKSSSHKSTAISIVEDLIELVDPTRTAPHEFSAEAIIQSLSEQSNRLFIFDEAKSFFDTLSKKYNESLKSLFTTLYRKPNYTRTTLKHGTLSIKNAYIPMGLATTPEWLRQSLQDAEQSAMSGFLARFLMIPYTGNGNSPMALPPPHDVMKFKGLVQMLEVYKGIEQTYHYSAESSEALKTWYAETTDRENNSIPVLGPFFEHIKNEAIHKLSILFAVDRGDQEVTLSALKEAILCLGYVEDMLPGLLEDMVSSKWDQERKRLVEVLRKKMVIQRSEVSRITHLWGQHLTAHLGGLHQDNVIKLEFEEGKTKRTQVITWVGE